MVSRSSLSTKNMQLKNVQLAARVVFTVLLLAGVYRETGLFTTGALALVSIGLEAIAVLIKPKPTFSQAHISAAKENAFFNGVRARISDDVAIAFLLWKSQQDYPSHDQDKGYWAALYDLAA